MADRVIQRADKMLRVEDRHQSMSFLCRDQLGFHPENSTGRKRIFRSPCVQGPARATPPVMKTAGLARDFL